VLGFDTIVVADGDVLGKPRDRAEAREMLERLAGRSHQVVTGVAVLRDDALDPETFAVTTPVSMKALTPEEIEAWVAGDECLGCAGAYNIEHHLASVADEECFYNVAGMPLCHVYQALERDGVPGLTSPVASCDEALCRQCRLGPALCGPKG
jgi:septum formation protein